VYGWRLAGGGRRATLASGRLEKETGGRAARAASWLSELLWAEREHRIWPTHRLCYARTALRGACFRRQRWGRLAYLRLPSVRSAREYWPMLTYLPLVLDVGRAWSPEKVQQLEGRRVLLGLPAGYLGEADS